MSDDCCQGAERIKPYMLERMKEVRDHKKGGRSIDRIGGEGDWCLGSAVRVDELGSLGDEDCKGTSDATTVHLGYQLIIDHQSINDQFHSPSACLPVQ